MLVKGKHPLMEEYSHTPRKEHDAPRKEHDHHEL
jgi:hypothetical protein